jgi:hypothetical protein
LVRGTEGVVAARCVFIQEIALVVGGQKRMIATVLIVDF